jgi:hypothetical protein
MKRRKDRNGKKTGEIMKNVVPIIYPSPFSSRQLQIRLNAPVASQSAEQTVIVRGLPLIVLIGNNREGGAAGLALF